MNSPDREQLRHLADHLTQRRPLILRAWHQLVDADPELTTASSISRTQFYDHIPQLLDAFADLLCAEDVVEKKQANAEQKKSAAEHGLHRWQQGYNQSQTMREWAHLHICLLDELEHYAVAQPSSAASVMHLARRALARLCGDGVCESAARYARLQQVEAAGRLRDLEQAVQHLQAVDRERAERWREAAHDLRSTVHVVTTAAAVLNREGVAEPARVRMSQTLHRGTTSLHALLAISWTWRAWKRARSDASWCALTQPRCLRHFASRCGRWRRSAICSCRRRASQRCRSKAIQSRCNASFRTYSGMHSMRPQVVGFE